MKKTANRSHSKMNNEKLYRRIRHYWNRGESRATLAARFGVSLSSISRLTAGWKSRAVRAASKKRTFDYDVAHCLLVEHGLTYGEAAFALEVPEARLRSAMMRNAARLEEEAPAWRARYVEQRRRSLAASAAFRASGDVGRATGRAKPLVACAGCGRLATRPALGRYHRECAAELFSIAAE